MWTWKRIALTTLLFGSGIACAIIPGAQAFSIPLISGGAGLALGIQMPSPPKEKKDGK